MFGYGRRRSHTQLAKAELRQSLGHLAQAANHTAGGIGATIGPRMKSARGYVAPAADRARRTAAKGLLMAGGAIAPLAAAASSHRAEAKERPREKAKEKEKSRRAKAKARRSGRRWPLMLASGVAAGVMTARAMRRHRRQEAWESYDPNLALETARSGTPIDTSVSGQPGSRTASTGPMGSTGASTTAQPTPATAGEQPARRPA